MKKFKFVSDVMLVVAAVALGLSLLIAGVSEEKGDAAFLTLMQLNAGLIGVCFVGVFLAFAKNSNVRILGNGMGVVSFGVSLNCAITTMAALSSSNATVTDPALQETSIGAIIVIVAAAFLLARYAFLLVDYLVNKDSAEESPNENVKVKRVKEWKQLLDEGIITEAEFEEKRTQILGIKGKSNTQE